jgi:alcohol dehydrogenase (cytochrome c)
VIKKLLAMMGLVLGPALLLAQAPQGPTYIPSGPTPLGPGDPDWRGETIQSGAAPPDTGGLSWERISKPLSDEWTSYSGDLTGKRYSALRLVNRDTVKNLSLKWITPLFTGCGPTGRSPGGPTGFVPAGRGAAGPVEHPIIVGGLANGDVNMCGPAQRLSGGILMVDGRLYAEAPHNLWAVDARDGTILWQNYWKTRSATLGTRGPGMLGNLLFVTEHDDWVLAIDARNGKEVWRHEIAPFDMRYFTSGAPMAINGHVLIGTGGDGMDLPAFMKSLNPRTGAVEWILYSTPQKAGDPGLETWSSLDAAKHGGGSPWIPGVYDPETNLYLYGTGNPTPTYTQGRGDGDNLFTGALLAVDVATGKMKWYFQTHPHDSQDFDSTQTPVIADLPFNGRTRKLVMTATRSGYFFVFDRTTGEHLVTNKLGLTNVWAEGINEKGQPKRNPFKDALVAGSLVNPSVLNYPPPTFSPDTGLFYINENSSLAVRYLMDPDPRAAMGLQGASSGGGVSLGSNIIAVDYKTGKVVWRQKINGGSPGLLSTAGEVLFVSNGQNVEAWDAQTGKPLWYSQIGPLQNPPETFMLDGKQHVLFTGSGSLYMFVLN